MHQMNLEGIDGTHLFGFMAALGTLVLLDERARAQQIPAPQLQFARDGNAMVDGIDFTKDQFIEAVFEELQASRSFYEMELSIVKKPTDFTPSSFARLAACLSRKQSNILSGLACCVGDEAFESTLCAANGASHQNLIQSMRDILRLLKKEHIQAALFTPWRKSYETSDAIRKQQELGTRKPTLRLDPADERLYAMRFSNPTTTDDFKTELGAQALAIPAFSILPVVPLARPLSVASIRRRNKVFFSWPLWDRPATLPAVRSLLVAGIEQPEEMHARGAFAAFCAARVSGEKGKLSFVPSEGVW
jgi:hypothetical protein